MFKRFAFVSLVVVLLVAMAPAVQTTRAQAQPTELTFWTFVQDHADYWVAQADHWNAEHPDRPITLTPTIYPWADMHDKLLLALQSGQGAPDLVDIEISRWGPFLKGDIHLQDLTDLVANAPVKLVESRMIYQKDGKVYGIDYHVGTYVMYYNTEVMAQVGVDIDSIKTWDDYIAAGKKVIEATNGEVMMAPLETIGCFPGRALMLMNGGGVYDKDGNLIVDSPANAEALQFMADLMHVHKIAAIAPGSEVHSQEFYAAMNEGKFASMWMPQWYMTRFTNFMPDLEGKIAVRPMPIWPDKPGTFASSMGGGTGTAITDQIDEDKLQLAKDFLAYGKLTYEAGVRIWTELGFDPIVMDVYDDPELTKPLPYFHNEDVFSMIKQMQPSLAPEYLGPQYADALAIIGSATCYDILEGGVPPAEALASLKEQLASME
jgi:arabinosaccharide transport system substrate-binding protein